MRFIELEPGHYVNSTKIVRVRFTTDAGDGMSNLAVYTDGDAEGYFSYRGGAARRVYERLLPYLEYTR